MRGDTSSPQIDDSDEAWSEIEMLVDETANLARMAMSSHEFHSEFVKRLVQATNARSTAIWCRGNDGQFSIEAQISADADGHSNTNSIALRTNNVAEVSRIGQPASLLPHQSATPLQNPSSDGLVLQPAIIDEQVIAVVESYHDDGSSPAETNNTAHLVSVFAELISEFHQNRQLRELRHREAAWTELEQFADRVHQSLNLKKTAFSIANAAAPVTYCDRVIVFHSQTADSRTLSISGVDSFDRRSTQVRAAERLAIVAARNNEPLWYPDANQALPPQLETCLLAYLDLSHARSLAVVPLDESTTGDSRENIGVLLFERSENTPWTDSLRRRVEFVSRHGATALQNANELDRLPLIGANRLLQRCLSLFSIRHFPKTAAVMCLLATAIVALVVVPADFEIRGEGQLRPTHYRHIFAPADGVIQQLHVHHAETVTDGSPLLEMRRTDLEYEEARLLGEILTNQKRLDSVSSAILNHEASSAIDVNELTSEEARLKILLTSLAEQQVILDHERTELSVVSPIAGEILTWGIEEVLSRRPVRRGERLLSVADSSGPWQLDLRIADHDIEYVLDANHQTNSLAVNFILTSHTGQPFQGTVEDIAMATELDEYDQPTVLVRVAIDRDQLPDLRPGATVVANVHCGRRPIGYVWFRELFEVIKTRVLF
ncbi:MAG: efflux RND transporter periplasmic adaptor subunit [Planctomycetes bacterium]|nr:efflux RND transporter periplasmic adaptor subunit [Planctomycetota bacterium]